MTTLGINEKFILSFLITKKDGELYDQILRKLTASHKIESYAKAPAMVEVTTEVLHIRKAVDLMNDINLSLAMIEEAHGDWNKGLLTRNEYSAQLSKYMAL